MNKKFSKVLSTLLYKKYKYKFFIYICIIICIYYAERLVFTSQHTSILCAPQFLLLLYMMFPIDLLINQWMLMSTLHLILALSFLISCGGKKKSDQPPQAAAAKVCFFIYIRASRLLSLACFYMRWIQQLFQTLFNTFSPFSF